MRDRIDIGSSPCDEHCVQVNKEGDYHDAMKAECRRFLDLVRKKLGPEPPGAHLAIKSNPHDFGMYYDVVCWYDDDDEEARAYAFRCESQAPRTWNDDKLTPEEEAAEKAREEARGDICRVCGEELDGPELLAEHLQEHTRARQGQP